MFFEHGIVKNIYVIAEVVQLKTSQNLINYKKIH